LWEIKHEKPCPFDQEKLEALTVPIEKGGNMDTRWEYFMVSKWSAEMPLVL